MSEQIHKSIFNIYYKAFYSRLDNITLSDIDLTIAIEADSMIDAIERFTYSIDSYSPSLGMKNVRINCINRVG